MTAITYNLTGSFIPEQATTALNTCEVPYQSLLEFCKSFDNYLVLIILISLSYNLLILFLQYTTIFKELYTNHPNELIAFNIGMNLIMLLFYLMQGKVI